MLWRVFRPLKGGRGLLSLARSIRGAEPLARGASERELCDRGINRDNASDRSSGWITALSGLAFRNTSI